jgi:hypothetical protein
MKAKYSPQETQDVMVLVGLAQAIGAITVRVRIRAVIGVDPVEFPRRGSDAQELRDGMSAEGNGKT